MTDAQLVSSDDSDDDDLDYIASRKTAAVPQKRKVRLPSVGEDEEEEEEEESLRQRRASQPVRTIKHEHGTGERVLMTDDEDDDTYGEWKRKMIEDGKRKRTVTKASRPGGLGAKIKRGPVERKVKEKKSRGEGCRACPFHIPRSFSVYKKKYNGNYG